jgi:signal transduction histidine kinase
MAVVFAATGVFVYVQFQRGVDAAIDEGLRSRAETVLAGVGASQGGHPSLRAPLVDPDEALAQVLARDGSVVQSSGSLSRQPLLPLARLPSIRSPTFLRTSLVANAERFRARLFAVPVPGGPVVVVGAGLEDRDDALERLAGLLWAGGLAALALSGAAGWLLAGAALGPIERMRAEAAVISAAEPGRRLPLPAVDDEIARLGTTLNDMLDRLEAALDRERRFVADASHELRTPLSILKGELELALLGQPVGEDLRPAVLSAAEEVDRLCRLSEDLLVLAKMADGRVPIRRSVVDLRSIVGEACDSFGLKAQEAGVTLEQEIRAESAVELDPLRFRQALGNVLDNALRHTPAGGRVSIAAGAEGGRILVEVADTGEGFPAGFVEEAFQPFRRADSARSQREDNGAGLGLSIVDAVVRAHGGSVQASNRAGGGALVRIEIPQE